LLLNCSFPFTSGLELPPDLPGEPARYGSCFHAAIAHLLLHNGKADAKFTRLLDREIKKYKIPPSSAKNLPGHVKGSYQVLKKWLEGSNPFGTNFFRGNILEVEKSFAFKFGGGWAVRMREIDLPTVEDHFYEDLEKGEIAATNDLVLGPLVIDHKTGSRETFHLPAEKPQLKTLGLIPFSRGLKKPILGVLHADRMGLPIVYADEAETSDLEDHVKKVEVALSRIDDGSMRPGPWCTQCPAREACPAQHGELLKRSSQIVKQAMTLPEFLDGSDEERHVVPAREIGAVHLLFSRLESLLKVGREELKTWVKDHPGEQAVRPDGKVLTIVEREHERFSKEAFIEKLGKVKAEKEFARLRKLGILTKKAREELHAVDD
jgi:hypothetical protein